PATHARGTQPQRVLWWATSHPQPQFSHGPWGLGSTSTYFVLRQSTDGAIALLSHLSDRLWGAWDSAPSSAAVNSPIAASWPSTQQPTQQPALAFLFCLPIFLCAWLASFTEAPCLACPTRSLAHTLSRPPAITSSRLLSAVNGAATTTTRPRFELPALDLNFGSITDGTNIPPPPASPVRRVPTPPQTPPPAEKKKEIVRAANGAEKKLTTTPPNEGRLMSMGSASVANGARPDSRGTASVMDDRKPRRSSGWFRRLRGGDSKRASIIFDDAASTTTVALPRKVSSGPPPPMIPELVDLEKDEGSLGGDLFKNIK
ncbi:Uncharacterized protein TPAR_00512, partial [Tolypocladium paradoxum]